MMTVGLDKDPLVWNEVAAATKTPVENPDGWRGLLLGQALELERAGFEDLVSLPGVKSSKASVVIEARMAWLIASDPASLDKIEGVCAVAYHPATAFFRGPAPMPLVH